MNQPMFEFKQYGPWMVTHKGDRSCRQLAERAGIKPLCRPGRNLVLRTAMGNAVWVTWDGIRDDGLKAWECTIFRNESRLQSSDMIRAAVDATLGRWGDPPADGIIVYAGAGPAKEFEFAGWAIGASKRRGLVLLQYQMAQQVLF